ncbi:MAG: SH3 domain-containing protein [Spirochaetaceae bacterium]|jgi:hypothetical protein|nr:SH3 domain-containing protein [Spirochaetaceae bacterium]
MSCTRLLGWGVLLWSSENPEIPSGTVLPVYIRSNIDQVWVAGVPEEYRGEDAAQDKFELPLWQLEFFGSKRKALEYAVLFAQYARSYAETLQDGLPIRDNPDNSARRVYRLRQGEMIKILARTEGTEAISSDGSPLPGDWYRVLCGNGTIGYCFSYRLRIFEHQGGALAANRGPEEKAEDPELDLVFSQTWSPDWWGTMVSQRRIDLDDLSRGWYFSAGQDTGIARIVMPDLNKSYAYTGVRRLGSRSWLLEGTGLQMSLRTDTTLLVQIADEGGSPRTFTFVALNTDVADLIAQETERREAEFQAILTRGPRFSSSNYGNLSFNGNGTFVWSGFSLLIPQVIPEGATGRGTVDLGVFLSNSLSREYTGVFTLRFERDAEYGPEFPVSFMYTVETQGIRIEYAPPSTLDGLTVVQRSASPLVMYFYTETGEYRL